MSLQIPVYRYRRFDLTTGLDLFKDNKTRFHKKFIIPEKFKLR